MGQEEGNPSTVKLNPFYGFLFQACQQPSLHRNGKDKPGSDEIRLIGKKPILIDVQEKYLPVGLALVENRPGERERKMWRDGGRKFYSK